MQLLDEALKADFIVLCDSLAQPGLPLLQHWVQQITDPCLVCLAYPPSSFAPVKNLWNVFAVSSFEGNALSLEEIRQEALNCRLLVIDSFSAFACRFGQRESLSLLQLCIANSIKVLVCLSIDLETAFDPSNYDVLTSTPLASSTVRITLHPLALAKSLQSSYGITFNVDAFEQPSRAYTFLKQSYRHGWAVQGVQLDQADEYELDTYTDGLNAVTAGKRCLLEWDARGISLAKKPDKADKGKVERGLAALVVDNQQIKTAYLSVALPHPKARAKSNTAINDLAFDLSLTDAQRKSKDSTILPFVPAAEGKGGLIHYEVDSNDDLDSDEPDEELEI